MGQRTPIKRVEVTPHAREALSWAQIAGLVEIHPDGSWNLTELGIAGVRQLQGRAHPYQRSASVPIRVVTEESATSCWARLANGLPPSQSH